MYSILFMSQAQKDTKKLSSSGLKKKALQLIQLIQIDEPHEHKRYI